MHNKWNQWTFNEWCISKLLVCRQRVWRHTWETYEALWLTTHGRDDVMNQKMTALISARQTPLSWRRLATTVTLPQFVKVNMLHLHT